MLSLSCPGGGSGALQKDSRSGTEKQICLRTGGTFGPGAADECVFVFVLCLPRNPSALASAERKNRKLEKHATKAVSV